MIQALIKEKLESEGIFTAKAVLSYAGHGDCVGFSF